VSGQKHFDFAVPPQVIHIMYKVSLLMKKQRGLKTVFFSVEGICVKMCTDSLKYSLLPVVSQKVPPSACILPTRLSILELAYETDKLNVKGSLYYRFLHSSSPLSIELNLNTCSMLRFLKLYLLYNKIVHTYDVC
jgi:hypothetical protein